MPINEIPERRAFEQWFASEYGETGYDLFKRDADGDYAALITDAAWRGWTERAGRAREYSKRQTQEAPK